LPNTVNVAPVHAILDLTSRGDGGPHSRDWKKLKAPQNSIIILSEIKFLSIKIG
jgi:hypothetical protein